MMIQDTPKNGAEIMDGMEATSRGWWRPSPGSVYPMLQQMSDEGLVRRRQEDGKYEITAQGKEEVEWPTRMRPGGPRSVGGMIDDLSNYVSYLEDLAREKDPRLMENAGRIKELAARLSRLGETP